MNNEYTLYIKNDRILADMVEGMRARMNRIITYAARFQPQHEVDEAVSTVTGTCVRNMIFSNVAYFIQQKINE